MRAYICLAGALMATACDRSSAEDCSEPSGRISTPAASVSSMLVSGEVASTCAVRRLEVAGILATPKTRNFETWEALIPAAAIDANRLDDGDTVRLTARAWIYTQDGHPTGGQQTGDATPDEALGHEIATTDVLVGGSRTQRVGALTLEQITDERSKCSVPVGGFARLRVTATRPESAGARVRLVGGAEAVEVELKRGSAGASSRVAADHSIAVGDAERGLVMQAQGQDAASDTLLVNVSGPPVWSPASPARRGVTLEREIRTMDSLVRCGATFDGAQVMIGGVMIESGESEPVGDTQSPCAHQTQAARITFEVTAAESAFVDLWCEDKYGRRTYDQIRLDASLQRPAPGLSFVPNSEPRCPLPDDGSQAAELTLSADAAAIGAQVKLTTSLGTFGSADAMQPRTQTVTLGPADGDRSSAVGVVTVMSTQAGTAHITAMAVGATPQTARVRFVARPTALPADVTLRPGGRDEVLIQAPTPVHSCAAVGSDHIRASVTADPPQPLDAAPFIRPPGDCEVGERLVLALQADAAATVDDALTVYCWDAWGRAATTSITVEPIAGAPPEQPEGDEE